MSTDVDLQPEDLAVLQAEDAGPEPTVRTVVAKVETPVRTQALPRKAGATRTRTGVTTTPVRFLAADHRRASAAVVSIGQNMLIALVPAAASDPSTMALWPQNVPFILTADTELWVASATGTTTVTVITELWAAGD
jgi:hypothetical protein